MNFREAEAYLLSLGNEVTAMKLGLENTRSLLAALGNPENNYLKVQVAGTNGKGSVCAFLKAICLEAGIKAGVYTSPHLISITERINIGGVDVSEDEFAKLATTVRETAERLVDAGEIDGVPTFFEQVTAIALMAFAEAKVELAILETGLGGRLDATTAANADVLALTRIDIDHQDYLGNTLAEIASEKAAIIEDEFDNVVIGRQHEEAMQVIFERCRQLGTIPVDERYPRWRVEPVGQEMVRVETTRYVFPEIVLGLRGKHQIENAETAINVMQSLRYDCGVSFDDEDVIAGLQNVQHPGRLELHGPYLFDGAHNIGGAMALRAFLDEFVDEPITLIFGAMKDKDARGMAEILFPKVDHVVLTTPDNSRAMSAADIAEQLPDGFDQGKIIFTNSTGEALRKADEVSADGDAIVVTGSLYLVGEAKQLLTGGIA